MVDIVHWNYLCLHIVWHCDIVWHWKYLCLHVVSTHCVYTLENIHLMQCKICAGQKLSVQVQLKISATICDYGTVQSPRKYLSQCWHCSLEIIFDKPYGEHFLVTLSPFRNVIISSSSESSTMDWDADELNNPCQISIEWCWWCDHTLSIENVWKLQANDKQCSKQFSK